MAIEAIKIIAAGSVLIVIIVLLTSQISYTWHWHRVPQYLYERTESGLKAGLLVQGLGVTLAISGISLILTFAIGLLTALFRL